MTKKNIANRNVSLDFPAFLLNGPVMKIMTSCFIILFSGMIFCNTAYCAQPARIVSLAPSITEILYDLGLGVRIVAVTDFCDYPEEAKSKPKIGGYANPSLEAIIAVKPDLVILAEDGNPLDIGAKLRKLKINTYVFRARRLRELPQGIRDLGNALGIENRADRRASEIETQLNYYAGKFQSSASRHLRRKALFIIHPEPLLVAGHNTVIDDALTLLGLQNIAADAGAPYAKYTLEEVIRRTPDIIFFGQGPMSRNLSKALLRRLQSLEAVQKGHVYYTSELLYRLTPRTIQGIEEIARHLNKP